ncbi:MAG TPA: hypothetical protein PKA53_13390 [Sphingobacterium sp.]|nr:hypothetical protein [Sphingobacterium sp.]
MRFPSIYKYISIFGIPVLYALLLRGLFGISDAGSLFSVMTISFLFFGPMVMGILTTYFADEKDRKSKGYIFFAPWLPLFIFFVVTILLKIEGWACWVMVFPIFMIAASLGGYIGAHLKQQNGNKTYISILMLIPVLLSPLENSIKTNPQIFKAYTHIDINATPDKIWDQVTRVASIDEKDDTGWLTRALGFPRPLHAELNYDGVGAYRKAVFTNGLVFHETVTAYAHQKMMTFTIKANPHEIPSTTLDEHVAVGGQFFDVLNGTYELERIGNKKYRLHLYSHFVLKTTFNFYAGIWAKWIMKDIQNNILRIEKKRAES